MNGSLADTGHLTVALRLPKGSLILPAYLPDATYGYVRALDGTDLERVEIPALVMNVFHLMQRPGSSTIQALGGLHRMAGWTRPIVTDSGGFQAYSLIRQNPRLGSLSDRGIRFKPEGGDRTFLLTPEKSVQLQLAYGSDLVICLDDCTHADEPLGVQAAAVDRTIKWARRCKEEFEKQMDRRKEGDSPRPLLFGVVQGGGSEALRRQCAERLLEIGFDGYGYGGWPLDREGHLLEAMLAYTRSLVPRELPMHALGVGQPESIVTCRNLGYDTFDSALPTRDARQGRIYAFTADPEPMLLKRGAPWRRTLYIEDKKWFKREEPISPYCDCPTCERYSVAYLRHLYKMGDSLYLRLATLHNLRFMTQLMSLLQTDSIEESLPK